MAASLDRTIFVNTVIDYNQVHYCTVIIIFYWVKQAQMMPCKNDLMLHNTCKDILSIVHRQKNDTLFSTTYSGFLNLILLRATLDWSTMRYYFKDPDKQPNVFTLIQMSNMSTLSATRSRSLDVREKMTNCCITDKFVTIEPHDTTDSQYTYAPQQHYCLSHQADNVLMQWQCVCACVFVCV